jgi:chitinase
MHGGRQSSFWVTFLICLLSTRGSCDSTSLLPCPSACYDGDMRGGSWLQSRDLAQLGSCDQPLALFLDRLAGTGNIFACSTPAVGNVFARSEDPCDETSACGGTLTHKTPTQFNVIRIGKSNSENGANTVEALRIIQNELSHSNTTCESTTSSVMVGQSVVGVYAGAAVPLKPFATTVLDRLINTITSQGTTDGVYIESCDGISAISGKTMGIAIGNFSTLPLVHSAIASWSHGGCMTTNYTANSTATHWQSLSLPLWSHSPRLMEVKSRSPFHPHPHLQLSRRDDCSTIQVKPGDSCGSLATACGISAADFTKYNSDPSLCSTLTPGQYVCCSAGSLPDLSPKPQEDGTCAVHKVVSGDTCSGIAAANSITVDNIGTW